MIPRQHFVNKLRELNYTYKTKQKRTELWRKRGGTHYISMPLSDLLEEEWVTSTLRQAGQTQDDIRSFIAAARA
ncbi:MAG: hypothetical protein HYY95_07885 [Candidatus Rokubacteria bacterium]|nr:hypothetical protein [Candidatus Rokubacteria bacterium]